MALRHLACPVSIDLFYLAAHFMSNNPLLAWKIACRMHSVSVSLPVAFNQSHIAFCGCDADTSSGFVAFMLPCTNILYCFLHNPLMRLALTLLQLPLIEVVNAVRAYCYATASYP